MRFDDYIWDFDGTLCDSYRRIARAYQQGLAQLGLAVEMADILRRVKKSLGEAAEEYAQRLGMPADFVKERMLEGERRQQGGLDLYPGAAALLETIAARGGRHFLYTHRDLGAVEALRQQGVLPLFTGWVTEEDAFARKPAPDAIDHLAARHGIDRARAVMVGDRPMDLEAGWNAGLSGCLFDPDGFYLDYDCSMRAASMAELAQIFEVD